MYEAALHLDRLVHFLKQLHSVMLMGDINVVKRRRQKYDNFHSHGSKYDKYDMAVNIIWRSTVQPVERKQTHGHTHTRTLPKILPLPLTREVKIEKELK